MRNLRAKFSKFSPLSIAGMNRGPYGTNPGAALEELALALLSPSYQTKILPANTFSRMDLLYIWLHMSQNLGFRESWSQLCKNFLNIFNYRFNNIVDSVFIYCIDLKFDELSWWACLLISVGIGTAVAVFMRVFGVKLIRRRVQGTYGMTRRLCRFQ